MACKMYEAVAPIVLPKDLKSSNEELTAHLEALCNAKTTVEQLDCIKKLTEYGKCPDDANFITKVLCDIFLMVDSKHPVKKSVTRVLLSQNKGCVTLAMTVRIVAMLPGCENCEKSTTLSKENRVLNSLSACFNNFPPGLDAISKLKDVVLLFACNVFMLTIKHLYFETEIDKNLLKTYIYNSSKFLVSLLNQCDISSSFSKISVRFLAACYLIIKDENIAFNTRANCGILYAIAAVYSPDNDEKDGLEYLVKFKFSGKGVSLLGHKSETVKICLFSGILNMVPHEIICSNKLEGMPAPIYIFKSLLESAYRQTGKPLVIMEISRTFISLSRLLFNMEIDEINCIFKAGLDYIWTHLDHFIDTVRHDTILVLKNFIKIASMYERAGNNKLINQVMEQLHTLLENQNTNFKALMIIGNETSTEYLLKVFPDLPEKLLKNMKNSSIAQQVCSSYEQLMEQYSKTNPDKWIDVWVQKLVPLIHDSESQAHIYCQKIFIAAFKLDQSVIQLLTRVHENYDSDELQVLLGCFITARKLNTIPIYKNEENSGDLWNGMLKHNLLNSFMCHQIAEIRILTLTLIIECQKTTEILPEWDLRFLNRFLHYNITTQLPSLRQQIIALYKKAFLRFKESLYVIQRNIKTLQNKLKKKSDTHLEANLKIYEKQESYYKKFISDLFESELVKGLLSDVNYPRRSNTLELLLFLRNCLSEEHFAKLWKKEHVILLYNALDDSYESNIMMASKLLLEMPKSVVFYQTKGELKLQLESAFALASSIKPTSTISAAYYLEVYKNSPLALDVLCNMLGAKQGYKLTTNTSMVLFQYIINALEKGISIAKDNILMASKYSPIYGLIFCLRHLMKQEHFEESDPDVIPKLIDVCKRISEVASPIVNSSSPEGFLPTHSLIFNDETITSQMVLVYAWRTVKEISLLLGEISFKNSKSEEIISKKHLGEISDYFINLFMETKHRGAYEQAYIGFSKFCMKLWNSKYEDWPKQYLTTILDVIDKKQENFTKICSTRRSAGLPFMIQAILTTEPQSRNNESFHHCMSTLMNVAVSNDEKAATHSMNILRALYKHNQMGELVTPYVETGVQIAIVRFSHTSWGVRNAATLMFSALMMRMFGVQRSKDTEDISIKNRLSAKVFFMRYPELYAFILEKLKEYTTDDKDNISIYPLLLILARLFPSGEKTEMKQYLPFINSCLSSNVYKTRELAAQASISAIPIEDYNECITTSLETISKVIPENLLHGTLLQLKLLVKNLPSSCELDIPALVVNSFNIITRADTKISSMSATLYIDIIIMFITKFKEKCYGRTEFRKLMEIILDTIENTNNNNQLSTNFELTKITLYLHLLVNIINFPDDCREVYLKNFLFASLHSKNEDVQIYALNCIKYMFENAFSIWGDFYSADEEEKSLLEHTLVTSMEDIVKLTVLSDIVRDLGCNNIFTDLFHILRTRRKEYALKVCLILPYLPCTVNRIRPKNIPVVLDKQLILDFLVAESLRLDSDMFSGLLPVISTLIGESKDGLDCTQLINEVLKPHSESARSFDERMAVCNFVVENYNFIYDKEILSVKNIVEVWHIVITLLQDNDLLIRERMGNIASYIQCPMTKNCITEIFVISEKSLEDLLHWMPHIIPFHEAMKIYLTLALKPKVQNKPPLRMDFIEVFDKGELNVYEEGEPMAIFATHCLKQHLWTLSDDLNYDDNSIFIEEHTLLVATKLFNLLYGYHISYMRSEDKLLSMLVLKEVMNYLEARPIRTEGDFKKDFTNVLEKKFMSIFSQNPNVFKDCRVEAFLKRFFKFEE